MLINKTRIVLLVVIALLIATTVSIMTKGSDASAANKLAQNAADQIGNSNIEQIITTSFVTNQKSSYTKDMLNLREKSTIYDLEGEIINEIIINEKGSRVTTFGIEDGVPTAYTWVLPKNISDENEKNLHLSILDDLKRKLENANWKNNGSESVAGKTFKKIIRENGNRNEVMYIDSITLSPFKLEILDSKTGELLSIEEYQIVESIDEKEFVPKAIAKEIPAPVQSNEIGDNG